MHIWVDADACPRAIKDILYRAANRVQILLTLVANKPLSIPRSDTINSILVPGGFDVADNHIIRHVQKNDLVITADIPLAAEVIKKNAYALSPRGQFFTTDNIRERLSLRNFMNELRSSGVETGGPAAFKQKNCHAFANQLDRFLAKHSGA